MRGSNPPKPSSRHRLGRDLPHKTEAQFRKSAFGTFLGRTAGIIFIIEQFFGAPVVQHQLLKSYLCSDTHLPSTHLAVDINLVAQLPLGIDESHCLDKVQGAYD